MKPEDENIEALSRAILRDVRAEADGLQEEAKAKAEAIRQRAQAEAEFERKVILDKAKQDAERLRSQAVATAQLKARTMQLEHREKLLDKVFTTARERLSTIQKRADYDKLAAQLLKEAITQLNAETAEVRADEATERFLKSSSADKVSKELNAKINFGKSLESGTGVVVDASNGRLHYDNTLESRLDRLQSSLRNAAYQVLMGEKI
ncbi:MAG: V-type ATP synthase subunit E family protein [Anaerolineales bacterium]